ncbi:MAG TPA: NUDIX hydrolase [Cryomorphaceae bacterium]|nr:NUDIX hydrolase [Owenweeksia sp.]MBF97687.1 NUDIX hydrolase [Owenweeksia sp.]HAD97628.1 NUDIX hydrolase [Cryomorphaceae bacterium]HBF21176.1 NUDIX hydrolase [Cryomorphaceae bacterium]|tara:strand:+ start:251 stop:925 length:675 start_codon:yes stop_codon:yes gene_type:complete
MKQAIKLMVDAVVFGYQDRKLSVLLIKRKYKPFQDSWALPGGYVKDKEPLEEAVERELYEETGVKIDYLEQLYTFGNPDRDPRGRLVSVAYFGLVRPDKFSITADTDAVDVEWFDTNKLPSLAFDHAHILKSALQRLRAKISYEPVGFELLDSKFLFGELEKLYMTILGRDIDRRNFRKKMLGLDILDQLDEKVSEGRGRPANLFQFSKERYFRKKKEGIVFEI